MRKDIKYKAVLFDLFGTLVHHCPKESFQQLMYDMASAMNMPLQSFTEQWLATSDKRSIGELDIPANLQYIAEKNNLERNNFHYQQVVAIRKKFFAERLNPRPETLATLQKIKDKNYKLALISDCGTDIPELFHKTEMCQYFDEIIFSSEAKVKKPNREIYLKALKALNITANEAIFIGDGGSNELNGADNIGIDAVWLKDNATEDSFRYNAQTTWHGKAISNLSEINNLI